MSEQSTTGRVSDERLAEILAWYVNWQPCAEDPGLSQMEADAISLFRELQRLRSSDGASEQHQQALDRACYVIMELMQAYERRIRSDCTTPEQLAANPWECAEYIKAERFLKAIWKDGRAQPFAALDEFLGYLRTAPEPSEEQECAAELLADDKLLMAAIKLFVKEAKPTDSSWAKLSRLRRIQYLQRVQASLGDTEVKP